MCINVSSLNLFFNCISFMKFRFHTRKLNTPPRIFFDAVVDAIYVSCKSFKHTYCKGKMIYRIYNNISTQTYSYK